MAEEEMDPRIWANIPGHVLDLILAFLPTYSILRMRSVSKSWRSTLTSAQFRAGRRRRRRGSNTMATREVLFVMFAGLWDYSSAAAYNPSRNKWHALPMSHFNSHPKTLYGFHVVAAAGGLLCTEVTLPSRSLVVVDPIDRSIDRSFKKLPAMLPMSNPTVVGFILDEDTADFKVLVVEDGEVSRSQCYDSRKRSWALNPPSDMKVSILPGMVSVGGLLIGLSSCPTCLIAHNIEDQTWCNMQVEMPASISSPHLIRHNTQLFLIGGVEEGGEVKSIRIWKLDHSRRTFGEMERMPVDLFQDFSRMTSADVFFCRAEAGFVCLSDGVTPALLMYDMNEKRWSWLPQCPFPFCTAPKGQSKYALDLTNPIGFPITT